MDGEWKLESEGVAQIDSNCLCFHIKIRLS